MRQRLLPALYVALLFTGCATESISPQPTFKDVRVEVVDRRERVVPDAPPQASAYAALSLIQGSLFGRITTDTVLYVPVNFGESARLPLDVLTKRVELVATAHSAQLNPDDLVVTPAKTRLARIGTFFTQERVEGKSQGGWFADSANRDTLLLAYFSDKCTVKGEWTYNGNRIAVDLQIPGAGLHWLRVVDDGPDRQHLQWVRDVGAVSLVKQV